MSKPNIDLVIDYLHDNYYDDMVRMSAIKMIAALTVEGGTSPDKIPGLVDKVALFNGIKKSSPPPKSTKQKIIEGIGFIMYGA